MEALSMVYKASSTAETSDSEASSPIAACDRRTRMSCWVTLGRCFCGDEVCWKRDGHLRVGVMRTWSLMCDAPGRVERSAVRRCLRASRKTISGG